MQLDQAGDGDLGRLIGLEPAQEPAGKPGAGRFVAEEMDLAGGIDGAGLRFGGVMEQRGPADMRPGRGLDDDLLGVRPEILLTVNAQILFAGGLGQAG